MNEIESRFNDLKFFFKVDSIRKLAKEIGISNQRLLDFKGGRAKKLARDMVETLEKVGINHIWLETGEGNMLLSMGDTPKNIQQIDTNTQTKEIGTYDNIETIPQEMLNRWFNIKFHDMSASACLGAMVTIDDLPHSFRPLYVGLNVKPENLRGIIVRGDSMKDAGINDGELIVYEVSREPRSGHEVICILNGVLMIKTYILNTEGEPSLHSSHNGKEPIPVRVGDNFQILGVTKYKVDYRN